MNNKLKLSEYYLMSSIGIMFLFTVTLVFKMVAYGITIRQMVLTLMLVLFQVIAYSALVETPSTEQPTNRTDDDDECNH